MNSNLAVAILLAVFLVVFAGSPSMGTSQPTAGDHLTVSGIIEEAQGKGVKKAENELLVDGKPVSPLADERVDTGSQGGTQGNHK